MENESSGDTCSEQWN